MTHSVFNLTNSPTIQPLDIAVLSPFQYLLKEIIQHQMSFLDRLSFSSCISVCKRFRWIGAENLKKVICHAWPRLSVNARENSIVDLLKLAEKSYICFQNICKLSFTSFALIEKSKNRFFVLPTTKSFSVLEYHKDLFPKSWGIYDPNRKQFIPIKTLCSKMKIIHHAKCPKIHQYFFVFQDEERSVIEIRNLDLEMIKSIEIQKKVIDILVNENYFIFFWLDQGYWCFKLLDRKSDHEVLQVEKTTISSAEGYLQNFEIEERKCYLYTADKNIICFNLDTGKEEEIEEDAAIEKVKVTLKHDENNLFIYDSFVVLNQNQFSNSSYDSFFDKIAILSDNNATSNIQLWSLYPEKSRLIVEIDGNFSTIRAISRQVFLVMNNRKIQVWNLVKKELIAEYEEKNEKKLLIYKHFDDKGLLIEENEMIGQDNQKSLLYFDFFLVSNKIPF